MAELVGPTSTGASFEAFRAAKTEMRAAEVACRQSWLRARTGDMVAWRRYRAALRRQERAAEALRHLDMIPRGLLSHAGRGEIAGPSSDRNVLGVLAEVPDASTEGT